MVDLRDWQNVSNGINPTRFTDLIAGDEMGQLNFNTQAGKQGRV